jgi:hypothetical protein
MEGNMKSQTATMLILFLFVPTVLLAGSPTETVVVPGPAGPWDTALNPAFDYGVHDNAPPVVINSTNGFSFAPGSIITVTYLSGIVDGHDATGDTTNITNNSCCSNGKFPGFYVNPGVPAYGGDLIGTFTNNGVIVGQPFPIGDGPATLTVPAGATQLQLGINDNKFSDNQGSYTVIVSQPYSVCLLYDSTKAAHNGRTIPIKLQLCDSAGNDSSSSTITLHATSVTQVSTSISGDVLSPGSANPDNDFRFDPMLGANGGYIFNLSTTGLTTGTYNLNFTVSGDSFLYATPFQVK